MRKTSRAILITGATSGIGKYATNLFAQRGWIVWAGYRNADAKTHLSQMNSLLIRPIPIDVTDDKSIAHARKTITKTGIPLNVLLNNAGVAFGAPIELLNIKETQKAFDVNFFGPIRMIQAFLPLLRQTSGRIVNISSLSGILGVPFEVPTSSSKFALEGMSDSLRREIKSQNISVSIIEPGFIKTEIWKKSIHLSLKLLKNKQKELSIYKEATDKYISLFENNPTLFDSLSILRKPLIHAVENKYPKNRYLVYRFSIILKILVRFLPSGLIDWMFDKILLFRFK